VGVKKKRIFTGKTRCREAVGFFCGSNKMQGIMRAGGEAKAAAGTALRINDSDFTPEAVGAFCHEGDGAKGASGNTAAPAGAVRVNLEGGIFLLHATPKNPGGVRHIFRCC
jgi:hypothetical protein